MTLKTYHYYLLGAFTFVAWVLAVVFALEAAIRLTS